MVLRLRNKGQERKGILEESKSKYKVSEVGNWKNKKQTNKNHVKETDRRSGKQCEKNTCYQMQPKRKGQPGQAESLST